MEGEKPKKKGKLAHKVYAVLIILLGLLILGMSIMILFHTKSIEVGGLEYASDDEVTEWVKKDEKSVNTLYLLWKYNVQKPELLPFLEKVDAKLLSPWSVKLVAEEKKIVGYITADDGYYYFDKEGLVVFHNEVPMADIPCIEGMQVEDKKLYKKLKTTDEKVFEHILDVTQLLKKENLKPDRILSDGKNVTLYFGEICAELGSGNYAVKIVQLPAVLEKLEGQSGVLRMSHYDTDSKYISFRRTDPEAAAAAQAAEDAANAAGEDGTSGESGANDSDTDGEDGADSSVSDDAYTDDNIDNIDNIDSSYTVGDTDNGDSGSDEEDGAWDDSYDGEE